MLACGLNTCRLAAKFARLFTGVHVILIPGRDRAGEEGTQHSARVLRGHASSIRVTERYEEAERLYQEAMEVFRETAGEEDPSFATGLNNLAGLCEVTGDVATKTAKRPLFHIGGMTLRAA